MGLFDNIRFPYFNFQELNLDWLLQEVKRIAGFMPADGNPGDILTKKEAGASWEPPEAVNININALPEDTELGDNDQLIFYDISAQANRKIKPPNLLDSMMSNAFPLMDGTAQAGTSKKPARYDHKHPTDTSRAPASYFQNDALKVINGGTGATSAAQALTNLGALANASQISDANVNTGYTGQPIFYRVDTSTANVPLQGYGYILQYNGGASASVQLLLYSTSLNIYIRRQSGGTWSEWHLIDTAYSSGESITFGSPSFIRWAGDWRTARDLWFTIPMERRVANLTASISGTIYVSCNGSRNGITISSASTVELFENDGGMSVHLAFDSDQAFAAVAYPVSVQASGVTITFT